MSKQTSMNMQEAAHGKKIFTQAEYAVAEALNESRYSKGLQSHVVSAPFAKWASNENIKHIGSFFYTTDQLADNYMGEEYYKRQARVTRFDSANINDDIDLFLSSVYSLKGMNSLIGSSVSVSVKMMDKALSSGYINLEQFTFDPENPSNRRAGWVESGKSDYSAFVLGHQVLVVNTNKLKKLSTTETMAYTVKEHLTQVRIDTNKAQGRVFCDAQNILIPIAEVKDLCDGVFIELPEWWKKKWNAQASDSLKAKINK